MVVRPEIELNSTATVAVVPGPTRERRRIGVGAAKMSRRAMSLTAGFRRWQRPRRLRAPLCVLDFTGKIAT